MNITTPLFFLLLFATRTIAQTDQPRQTDSGKPFVLGRVEEVNSVQLAEKRTLNIYLPEGYNASDTLRYPVIYLLDGSADEDFIHIVGLVQFNNFSWINRVPKSIVVGIANVDRRRDFTYPTTVEADKKRFPTTGHSDRFINFLGNELQPFIDQKYKTTTARTIIGQSLGGLLATEILLKQPRLFDKYIIVSPSLWWDNGSLLNQPSALAKPEYAKNTAVYIGVGKEGLTPGDVPRVMEVDANVLAEKIKQTARKQATVYFDYLPQEDHATVTHQAVFNALRLLYPAPVTNK